jgi:hypothetical protein
MFGGCIGQIFSATSPVNTEREILQTYRSHLWYLWLFPCADPV